MMIAFNFFFSILGISHNNLFLNRYIITNSAVLKYNIHYNGREKQIIRNILNLNNKSNYIFIRRGINYNKTVLPDAVANVIVCYLDSKIKNYYIRKWRKILNIQ